MYGVQCTVYSVQCAVYSVQCIVRGLNLCFNSHPNSSLYLLILRRSLKQVIWDLVAVLTPCGPLRYVMEMEQKRQHAGEAFDIPPGLVYEGGTKEERRMGRVVNGWMGRMMNG